MAAHNATRVAKNQDDFQLEFQSFLGVPKKKKSVSILTDRESGICERLRDLRLSERLKMDSVAAAVGMTKGQWVSYEYGRAPLKYELGRRVCVLFGASQRWLATGQLPKYGMLPLSNEAEAQIEDGILFSEAYDSYLKALSDQYYPHMADRFGLSVEGLDENKSLLADFDEAISGTAMAKFFRPKLLHAIGGHLRMLPAELVSDYVAAILDAANGFADRNQEKINSYLKSRGEKVTRLTESGRKMHLTSTSAPSTAEDVKIPERMWPKTLAQLRKYLGQPGKKTQFARDLGVTRQTVHRWLNVDEAEPSGNLALRIQRWIDLEENPE